MILKIFQAKDENRHRPWTVKICGGFSLIELLVTISIGAVIAAVAIPSYNEFVERSRRSEARAALGDLADRQEQYFLDNKTYAGSLSNLNVIANTENGYYTITIPVVTSISYTLRATTAGGQVGDTDCSPMNLLSTGAKTPSACW